MGEFLVWVALIGQSGGGLHIFLPSPDRGIDALVHRLDDGAFLALQVKAKTGFHSNEAPIAVLESHLFTDDQMVIGVQIQGGSLGDYALVADGSTFRRKAGRIIDGGRALLVADMPIRPIPGHKWSDDLVPTLDLATRLGARLPALTLPAFPTRPPDEDTVVGNWGEREVSGRLAMLDGCNVFSPFPDNETSEVVVRRLATGRTIGIQVKTAQLDEPHAYRKVLVRRANLVASPSTYLVAVAWIVPQQRFHETCLLMPMDVLPAIAGTSGPYFELHFRPDGSSEPSKVDRYRIPLEALGPEISKRLGT